MYLYINNEETSELVEGKCFMPMTLQPQIYYNPETLCPELFWAIYMYACNTTEKKIKKNSQ